jgi:hypothetical protein
MSVNVTPYKWNVLLCDDNPTDASIVATRANIDNSGRLHVTVLGSRDDFINSNELRNADIVLMDMKWLNFKATPPDACCYIPDRHNLNDHAFVSRWLETLLFWSSGKPKTFHPHQWPRKGITDAEIGAWLGAMISHLSSRCRFVFYSSTPGVADAGITAALGRFYEPSYEVITKDSHASLDLPDIARPLRICQGEQLQNPLIYNL